MESCDILYNEQAEKVLKFALKTMQSKVWQQVSEKLGTKLYKLSLHDKCNFPRYMTKTTINKPKGDVTEQKAKEWDPKLTS